MTSSLSHTTTETLLDYIGTALNYALNHRSVVVFGRLWERAAPIAHKVLPYLNVHAKYVVHVLLTSLAMWAISRTVIFRSFKTMRWISFPLSGVVTSIGRPERSASLMFVQLRLNSLNHSQIVDFEDADAPSYFASHYFFWTVFFPIKKQCLINSRNSLVSIFSP